MSWQYIYPKAIIAPGDQFKFYPDENMVEGIILHSIVDKQDDSIAHALEILVDGSVRKSWQFSIDTSGDAYQHYDLTASCWHSGSMYHNIRKVGIEHEGGYYGERLTEAQIQASRELCAWIAEIKGWERIEKGVHLHEHKEFYPTECPMGRIPWERYKMAFVTEERFNVFLEGLAHYQSEQEKFNNFVAGKLNELKDMDQAEFEELKTALIQAREALGGIS